ncbi:MAG: hypothetical protein ACLUD0_10270 [Eubacterium ramulus]
MRHFCEGMESFGRKIRGFNRDDSILQAVWKARHSSLCGFTEMRVSKGSEIRGLYPAARVPVMRGVLCRPLWTV